MSTTENEKSASRASIIAGLSVGETYSITEYVNDDVRAEHIQSVMSDYRKQISQRLASTIKFCQVKTGNQYSRETASGMTTQGRFAVTLIIERVA